MTGQRGRDLRYKFGLPDVVCEEGEDVLGDEVKQGRASRFLKLRPAKLVVRDAFGVLAFGEDAAFDGLLQAGDLQLLDGVKVVEAFQEE